MLQTYIMRSDVLPTEAVKQKLDASICGDCPHRGGSCYVNVGQETNKLWRLYREGAYKETNLTKLGHNQRIRLGAYGDPAAVPIDVWDRLLRSADQWTGYTHQWVKHDAVKKYCQASVDTETEQSIAKWVGWKTFRVKPADEPVLQGETKCPYPAMQCITCQKCDGRTQNIVVDAHGLDWKVRKFEEQYYAKKVELQLTHPV